MKKNDEIGIRGLTRRAVIAGTIVAADSFAAPLQLPFDVRTLVPDSDEGDAAVQATYDTINRMVVLIGDIPFSQLFSLPMREFVLRVRPRIQTAASLGLIVDANQITELADTLQNLASESTISSFFASPRSSFSVQAVQTLIALRRHGIRIPVPTATDDVLTRAREEALIQLSSVAPTLTFQGLFTTAKSLALQPVIVALTTVKQLGLLAWPSNDMCCRGRIGESAVCEFREGKLNILTGEGLSFCSLISDEC
jgi:hypothetical protein